MYVVFLLVTSLIHILSGCVIGTSIWMIVKKTVMIDFIEYLAPDYLEAQVYNKIL